MCLGNGLEVLVGSSCRLMVFGLRDYVKCIYYNLLCFACSWLVAVVLYYGSRVSHP